MSTSSHDISRKDFVKVTIAFLGTVMGAIVGFPAVGYLFGPGLRIQRTEAWIPLGALMDYPIGAPKPFRFTRSQVNGWEKTVTSYTVFVVRTGESRVRVFSNICTHLGCHVAWHPDLQHYVSPWNNGHFDVLGAVVSGPPPRPLDEFVAKIEDGKLFILYPPYKRS